MLKALVLVLKRRVQSHRLLSVSRGCFHSVLLLTLFLPPEYSEYSEYTPC